MTRTILTLLAACSLAFGTRFLDAIAHAADPWADNVESYTPGTGITNDFVSGLPLDSELSALGEPTRNVSPDSFPGAVTPFSGPYRSYEIVSIGVGGSLVLSFDEPVVNDPLNPFGIDLLVFGNAFFTGMFGFPFDANATIAGIETDGGVIAVSADGDTYFTVTGEADGLFPTNAYTDAVDGYGNVAGTVPADFTLPVDPSFNPIGKTFAQLLVGYNGSGGGVGVDIGPTGLSSISYVRITNPVGSNQIPQIDAVADVRAVPEPAAGALVLSLALILLGKSARTSNVNVAT
jgi:hypothetical protein